MLFSNAIQMLGCIFLFFICGLGILATLGRQLAFPAAASVFAGALVLSSAALTVHVATHIRFSFALWIAAAGLIGLSAATLREGAHKIFTGRDFLATAAALTVLVGASCFVYLGRENQFASPALVFFAGSDQFGYAHLADWLNGAPGNIGLAASPANPWESWVHYMVTVDPRFGSISFVAIVSALSGRSGMFSYNLSCALVMVTASVGLAGIFARSLTGFAIVAIGVFLSSWFSVSMAGFFGKTIGYPASLFGVGMFFALVRSSFDRDMTAAEFLSVLMIVVSACLAYNAPGTVVVLLLTGGARIAQLVIFATPRPANRWPKNLGEVTGALLALAVLGLISGGTIARPMYAPTNMIDPSSWIDLWLRAAQVIGPDANLSIIPPQYQFSLALLVGALAVAIALIAARLRNFEAMAILSGFATLALTLATTGKRWEFQQSLTLYVPAILCAVGALSAKCGTIAYRTAAAFAAIIIAIGAGRFAATVNATTGASANERLRLSQTEIDSLSAAVQSADGAYIDTSDVYATYPLVLELHRKGIPFQFSQRAWKSFLGYRPWDAPKYGKLLETTVTQRDNPAQACGPGTRACTEHYVLEKTADR
jgi:hypothetical protein